jgi:hypothetical protein
MPLAMFAVGFKLRVTLPRPFGVFAFGLAMKLLVLPASAWALSTFMKAPPPVLAVAVLETAMPTMITAGAILMAHGIVSELVAAYVGWGLVLSLLTVPAWSFLLAS